MLPVIFPKILFIKVLLGKNYYFCFSSKTFLFSSKSLAKYFNFEKKRSTFFWKKNGVFGLGETWLNKWCISRYFTYQSRKNINRKLCGIHCLSCPNSNMDRPILLGLKFSDLSHFICINTWVPSSNVFVLLTSHPNTNKY